MSIGLVCHFLEEDRNGNFINTLFEKNLQLNQFLNKKYTTQFILETYLSNLENLNNLIEKIIKIGFKSYRMSSGIFPLFDKVDRNILEDKRIKTNLKKIGEKIKNANMRVTFHPDHFVVLTSEKDNVISNSIQDLIYHAWVMDEMELDQTPFYAINIHACGKNKIENIIKNIKVLPDNVRKRLTLENDETSASVLDLFHVFKETGTPICFDSHHYVFNTGNIKLKEAIELSMSTWNNIKPIQHLSNTEPFYYDSNFQNRRKHSEFVHYIPSEQYHLIKHNKVDVDFEFKMKNIAILDCIKKFDISL
jgi:UV DNA damage endonuclease